MHFSFRWIVTSLSFKLLSSRIDWMMGSGNIGCFSPNLTLIPNPITHCMRSSMLEHICNTMPCPNFDENDPWSVITINYTHNETPPTPTFFTLISVFAALNAISLQSENSVDAKRCLSPTSTS